MKQTLKELWFFLLVVMIFSCVGIILQPHTLSAQKKIIAEQLGWVKNIK